MSDFDLEKHLCVRKSLIDEALNKLLPTEDEPPKRLHQAMRYVALNGGKRLRPTLLLDACYAVGGDEKLALPAACAIELIHTYSLVHDDMPCLDNDDLRRGRPTCHRVFGEAIALLCGDALLTLAFEVLAGEQVKVGVPVNVAIEVTRVIAEAAGHFGMVGGQVDDIEAQRQLANGEMLQEQQLYEIHRRKTGALIAASVEVGAIIGGASEKQRAALRKFGEELGLAFQVTDDLLDAVNPFRMKRCEPNIVAVLGIDGARRVASKAIERALMHLSQFDERSEPLRAIAKSILERRE
ncbi:MAG: polyprenyl synthetase family protein [Armatimonadota bacterium]|nr:polyprenyl synthetase family protein [Armatimonadota bacterium]MCX7777143.1 polyprenyl synthetase family protein [Armatimonadota bacterium]MDW8025190.1 polyprenyl synthetase family protein [Armatimonadota bacterium]